ncbi:helix-turn-helix transcriptional regulator [Desulfosporosinus sp. Sb-LF]|uniref:helix-turn-helix domain-containing protein n=1 Tax=Desulfosporosinus sp. Sb-LF TaxID=2560027 RepID=UPI00107F270B|nr:helix-turn-helix transcriptional regulator [Desulfosporosinus sp. Sb-LF]TGE31357.1 XRE family transcriptional regulator [Desulfosporosinus sp. Sb-LF]
MSEKEVTYAGQKTREARLKATIGSQKELAEKAGIAASIISDLERGKRPMSPTWARRIVGVVGVGWADLMD